MFIREELERDKRRTAEAQSKDPVLRRLAHEFLVESFKYDYPYQWTWLGLPMLQVPADIVATQEIIWENKPDVIIETGIAWGGSVVFYASLLQLIGKGEVIAVDLNLMDHVTNQIMSYPFAQRIRLLKGSSTDPAIAAEIKSHLKPSMSVMVLLDSNHTHKHVLDELALYGPLVTKGQYLIVSDTHVETVPQMDHKPRPWGPGNNPKSAVDEYLRSMDRFAVDEEIDKKLLVSLTPGGYLRCLK